jgi:hypothetical protein
MPQSPRSDEELIRLLRDTLQKIKDLTTNLRHRRDPTDPAESVPVKGLV